MPLLQLLNDEALITFEEAINSNSPNKIRSAIQQRENIPSIILSPTEMVNNNREVIQLRQKMYQLIAGLSENRISYMLIPGLK